MNTEIGEKIGAQIYHYINFGIKKTLLGIVGGMEFRYFKAIYPHLTLLLE
jgi:hypothetical protein